jgi:hypothetical protein
MAVRVFITGEIIDPMPMLRQRKVDEVNRQFRMTAADNLHRDQAHAQKRLWAATNDERLKGEADLRGMTVARLSAVILGKPDELAVREASRQVLLARIAACTTPQDLDAI